MQIGVVRESMPGERRVALTPGHLAPLLKRGDRVVVEAGAGREAGFPDDHYREAGAEVVGSRDEVLAGTNVLAQVRAFGANRVEGEADLDKLPAGATIVGLCDPLDAVEPSQELARRGISCFALELVPRITRAQTMDVLSSQANIGGYKAVLLAATELPRLFPMMMTAAGTLTAARVFIIGAGVAGLQAIATARRLGARVRAYDVRPAVREQVESLGAEFLEIAIDTGESEDKGGYARAMDDAFYRKQQELMTGAVADSDVVITTAVVPGRRAPILVTEEMVAAMRPGSVIVDLAAERGGNCAATDGPRRVLDSGVVVLGPSNLPGTVPYHASQTFARNMVAFLEHIAPEGAMNFDRSDEIIGDALLVHDGEIVQRRVREIFGLPALAEAAAEAEGGAG